METTSEAGHTPPSPVPPARARAVVPLGAHIGTTLGACGAAIGFCIACIVTGTAGQWWTLMVGALVVSASLGLLASVASEAMHQRCAAQQSGPGAGSWLAIFIFGEVQLMVGILVLLSNAFIAPAIEATPALMDLTGAIAGVHRVWNGVGVMCCAVGVVTLALTLRAMRRRAMASSHGPTDPGSPRRD